MTTVKNNGKRASKVLEPVNSKLALVVKDEATALVNATDNVKGKELRLGVALHMDMEFNVGALMDDTNKRGDKIKIALGNICPVFASKLVIAGVKKKAIEGMKGANGFKADVNKTASQEEIASSCTSFTRSLTIAYLFHACSALITHIDSKTVTFTPTKSLSVSGVNSAGEPTVKLKLTANSVETFKRKEVYESGRDVLRARGLLAVKNTAKAGAGDGVKPEAEKHIELNAATWGDTISKLPADVRDSTTNTKAFEKMLAQLVRAKFTDDTGSIDMNQVVKMLRDNEAMQGVKLINWGISPKPAAKKAA